MPRSCPACGRPNADRATECLYCTKPLGEALPEPPAAEAPSATSVSVSGRHLIILAPLAAAEPTDGKISGFAKEMGMTLYDARRALQTSRHRLLRKVDGVQRARELSARLQELGIRHFLLAEADVQALPVARVRWLALGREHLRLGLEGKDEGKPKDALRVAYEDVLLLVRGEIARERHYERRMATPRGASRPFSPGLRLHLYAAEAELAAEVDAEQLDWGALGGPRTASTPINLKRLVERILSRAAGAELDRGFDFEHAVLSHSEDALSLDAMLQGPRAPEGAMYDNVAQFRFYSRWRYLVARAGSLEGRS